VFGKVLHQLKFSEAIEQDLLSDYRVVIVGVDHPTVRKRIQNRKLLRTSNGVKLDAETLATHVALAKAVKDYDLHRVISFHSRVAGAKDFAQDHTEVLEWMLPKDRPSGTTITDFVSGNMNSGDRNTKINRLRHLNEGERGILSNARCLSEGVDVPSLDGVAFIDPRKSQVDIVQAVGRAIRKSEGKTHGTILIPVFIDKHEDEKEALESSRFKPIWDVVNALRSHDDDLAHELDSLRTELGRRKSISASSRGLEKIVFDLPEQCDQSFIDGLRTRLVEQTTASWMFWYGLLKGYAEENGNASPTAKFKTSEGFALSTWVLRQRQYKDSLTPERIALLESLKGWSWDPFTDKWNRGFERLKAYTKKNGHAIPKKGFTTSDGFALSSWVLRQRQYKDSLTPERIALLESLKGWSWNTLTDKWKQAFQILKAYAEENEHASPESRFQTKEKFLLGQWVSVQRHKKDSLTPERIALLESLKGWTWSVLIAKWNEGFERLKAYAKKNGHASPSATFKTDNRFSLGEWVRSQRKNKDSLSPEFQRLLESLKSWSWDINVDKWNKGFERLKAYANENENEMPELGFKTKDKFFLGQWASIQRRSKDTLTPERIALLESLKGWSWNPLTDKWNKKFERLKAFTKQTGAARPTQLYKTQDGFALGNWVASQRSNKDSLPTERIVLLEKLKGWSWDPFTDNWNNGFERLKEFIKQAGAANPLGKFKTKDGYKLGSWVSMQRRKKSKLIPEQKRLLQSLPGWKWSAYK
jgi:superfamily II DNA/RNA helicase